MSSSRMGPFLTGWSKARFTVKSYQSDPGLHRVTEASKTQICNLTCKTFPKFLTFQKTSEGENSVYDVVLRSTKMFEKKHKMASFRKQWKTQQLSLLCRKRPGREPPSSWPPFVLPEHSALIQHSLKIKILCTLWVLSHHCPNDQDQTT